jgi:protein-S-isoprenylcysteine O-methyltransferase Ste14
MLKLIAFIAISTGLVYVSRASLRAPRSHGFYRFFAWESILSLLFLNFENFEQWFHDPFSIRQLVSWFLLLVSLVPLTLGVHQLRTLGRPDTQRHGDTPLIGIEKTTQLVTTGVFKYIRHPLYSSLLLLTWGVFFKNPSWASGCIAVGATAFLLATVKAEEEENIRYFGPAYQAYMRETKMFIPFLF